ncbi:MAG: hypothetical protein H6751_03425 [Candidatus Omnitrophica bacterium]|nr:hypothetical protein [Candidatus Omnitrophota bacterium]
MRFFLPTLFLIGISTTATAADWRNIHNGSEIPTESYADQPYVVKTDDGAWLCVVTTGSGHEGQSGQHVVSMRSVDLGETWSEPVAIEPATGPEASYAVLLKVPSGRIYVFYNHNTDNLREARADNPPYKDGICRRVDSLGYYVFKYSDDYGRTWSDKRYPIPVREMEIDRNNPYGGKVRYFWNVGKPFVLEDSALVPLHKVGGLGYGFFTKSEGVLLKSPNILTESDPEKIEWETLPDGDIGLRTPQGGGPISEEQSFAVLSDGSIYCVYRSIDGHPVCTYSRDGGHSWSPPEYQCYADGRRMKHPRAANFIWKCSNGKYLYWFHNHGGRFIREHSRPETNAYNDRNPAWLCAGIEKETPNGRVMVWSQPEIALYDPDPFIRMSYPDFIEDGSRYFLTETQKDVARVHEIPGEFLNKIWGQFDSNQVIQSGLILETTRDRALLPNLPEFVKRASGILDGRSEQTNAGVTLDLWVQMEKWDKGIPLLDNRTETGKGFALVTTEDQSLELVMNDGRAESRWRSDPNCLPTGSTHHLGVVIDSGPDIVSFIVDGRFQDGGDFRQFGWGRSNPNLRDINGDKNLRILSSENQKVLSLRIYNRSLMTSEIISNYHAEK